MICPYPPSSSPIALHRSLRTGYALHFLPLPATVAVRSPRNDTYILLRVQSSLADGDTASTAGQTDGVEEYSDDSALEPDDPAALDTSAAAAAAATSATTCSWEFHAVYSKVWGAPVLYFNCYDESGTVLPLRLSPSATETPVISQQDHPHLGLPFYYLHPCTTREFLDSLSANGEDDDEGDGDKSAGVAWRHLVLWLHAAAWALTAVVSCPVATLLASSSDNRWLRRWAAPPPRSTP